MNTDKEVVKKDEEKLDNETVKNTEDVREDGENLNDETVKNDEEDFNNSNENSESEPFIDDSQEESVRSETPSSESNFALTSDGISVFAISQTGESHKLKNLPCQDRSGFCLSGNFTISAIADGVGSSMNSDLAAEKAVNEALACMKHTLDALDNADEIDNETMFKVLRDTMSHANAEVSKLAGENLNDYLTTLTVSVYDGIKVWFGHSGDGGIVAVNSDGLYSMITSRHNGDEANSVYPLQCEEEWEIGMADKICCYFMATDGVLDAVVKSYDENMVYFPFFAPVLLNEVKTLDDLAQNYAEWEEFLSSEKYRKLVTDDVTLVAVVNYPEVSMAETPVFDLEEWTRKTTEYIQKVNAALYGNKQESRKADETELDDHPGNLKERAVQIVNGVKTITMSVKGIVVTVAEIIREK